MKIKIFTFLLFISTYSYSCRNPEANSKVAEDFVTATAMHPYGRFWINKDRNLELVSSAVHVGFSFEGKQCHLFASIPEEDSHNYLQYEVDGVYQKRIRVNGNTKDPIVLTVPTEGKHTLWVYKATEAHTGPIVIEKIAGENIKPLRKPTAPTIEFIGNSITCGAAADPLEVPCGAGVYHDQHNAYMAYGPRVARQLKTNFVLSSVSGIGVYRNWNSNGPAMPQVYEKVDFQDENPVRWNFETFNPSIVSIALGTNDLSKGNGKNERLPFDSASYVTEYIKFVQLVKSKYPKAQIALLSSPMINGQNRQLLQNCLAAVKQSVDAKQPNDKPIALYFFKPMKPRGCTGHPNVEDHAIMAEQLVPFFRKLL